MSLNLNKVIIAGRLTADPELKQTQSGIPVVTFTLAVNRKPSGDQHPEADFFRVTAWRKTAELICQYHSKGDPICVIGEMHNRKYTDRDGIERTVCEMTANEMVFVGTKAAAKPEGEAPANYVPNFTPVDGDDLPF